MARVGMKNLQEISLLADALSLVPCEASIDEVVQAIGGVSVRRIKYVLSVCEGALRKRRIGLRQNDAIRTALMQVVVGAVPHSVGLIDRLLTDRSDRRAYEIQFTLFCCLGWMPNAQRVCPQVLPLVRQYLLRVQHKTAWAAWMAGDLLGHHWPVAKCLPVLMEVAKEARYAAGREAAITGLDKSLRQRGQGRTKRTQVVSLLEDIAKNDESVEVRKAAILILGSGQKKRKRTLLLLHDVCKHDRNQSVRALAEYLLKHGTRK